MYRISPSDDRLRIFDSFRSLDDTYIYIYPVEIRGNPCKIEIHKPRKYRGEEEEEPETSESLSTSARFEKVYRQHGGPCIIGPILQTCPGFQFITGIPTLRTEFSSDLQPTTISSSPRSRIPQGIVRSDRLSPIVYQRYSFSLREESRPIETLLNFSSFRDKKRYFFDAN